MSLVSEMCIPDNVKINVLPVSEGQVTGPGNGEIEVIGCTKISVQLNVTCITHFFMVVRNVKFSLLLGIDFLIACGAVVNLHKHVMSMPTVSDAIMPLITR